MKKADKVMLSANKGKDIIGVLRRTPNGAAWANAFLSYSAKQRLAAKDE